MSTTQTTTPASRVFDAEALRRGIEERDAATLLGLYAEDAELQVTDRNDQPSTRRSCAAGQRSARTSPKLRPGHDAQVERLVVDRDHAAFTRTAGIPAARGCSASPYSTCATA